MVQPLLPITFNDTLYKPGVKYTCVGLALSDVLPSPKPHWYAARVVSWLLKLIVRGNLQVLNMPDVVKPAFGNGKIVMFRLATSLHPLKKLVRVILYVPAAVKVLVGCKTLELVPSPKFH